MADLTLPSLASQALAASSFAAPPPAVVSPAEPGTDETATRARITDASKAFEASFLSTMMQSMFQGVGDNNPFGGGDGEKAFKSFFIDAMAKKVTQSGGVGLSHQVATEMLKMQGLS